MRIIVNLSCWPYEMISYLKPRDVIRAGVVDVWDVVSIFTGRLWVTCMKS